MISFVADNAFGTRPNDLTGEGLSPSSGGDGAACRIDQDRSLAASEHS
jgi:hypothetical protein